MKLYEDENDKAELTIEEKNEIKSSINQAQKIAGNAIVASDINNYLNSNIRLTQDKV